MILNFFSIESSSFHCKSSTYLLDASESKFELKVSEVLILSAY